MANYKLHLRFIYILIPISFLLMATILGSNSEDKSEHYRDSYNSGLPYYLVPVISPKDNMPSKAGGELGRRLFYDTLLSGNKKQSCASCHRQVLSFTDGKEITIGSIGQKARRNSMALINMGFQNKFFWDGRASTLEELIHFPVTDPLEMNADTTEIETRLNKDSSYHALFCEVFGTDTITMPLVEKAISQFLRTIVSYNTSFDQVIKDYIFSMHDEFAYKHKIMDDQGLIYETFAQGNEVKYGHGEEVVKKLKEISPDTTVLKVFARCLGCHYNSTQVMCPTCPGVQYKNNGLETKGIDKGVYQITGKPEDKYRFKVPTLRNLVFTAPYMHDGRFNTLEEVVEHYNSGIQPSENLDTLLMDSHYKPIRLHLTRDEKKQLIGLLKLFTDSSIVTDPRFGAPSSK